MHRMSLLLGRVRSDTIAEGPVLLLDLDEVDQDVLAPESNSCVKAVGDGLVERLLLRRRPAFIPGNLDNHEICTALDAEIFGIELEAVSFVLSNDLEAVFFRNADADKRFIDDATDLLAVGCILAFTDIDSNERHIFSPDSAGLFSATVGATSKIHAYANNGDQGFAGQGRVDQCAGDAVIAVLSLIDGDFDLFEDGTLRLPKTPGSGAACQCFCCECDQEVRIHAKWSNVHRAHSKTSHIPSELICALAHIYVDAPQVVAKLFPGAAPTCRRSPVRRQIIFNGRPIYDC